MLRFSGGASEDVPPPPISLELQFLIQFSNSRRNVRGCGAVLLVETDGRGLLRAWPA